MPEEVSQIAPFALLAVGLIVLLLSTRQWPLPARALIWLLGAGCLGAAGYLALSEDHHGLIALVADALMSGRGLADSALFDTLRGNWSTVVGNLTPMFDIIFVLAALVAFIALIAFTPGEVIERLVRPIMLILIGAIGGGFLALALVATGLGGHAKDHIYTKLMNASDVIDGDTMRMDGVSVRLWAIDAPEYSARSKATDYSAHNQMCRRADGAKYNCGADARAHLATLVSHQIVVCTPPVAGAPSRAELREAFGRPIVKCDIYENGAKGIDLAAAMAQDGFADVFADSSGANSPYGDYVKDAKQNHLGIWAGAALSPTVWRNDERRRQQFITGR